MKVAIFLIVVLAGAVMAKDCVLVAKNKCPEAFENYKPNIRVGYCSHVRKVEKCLKTVDERCYTHYWHTYEDVCGSHEV